MSTFTYRAIWQILDCERTRSALIAEACAALDTMAATDGARIVGDPVWTIADERLVCEAPAERLPEPDPKPQPVSAEDRDAARAKRDADLLRLAGLGWSSAQIGAVTGNAPSTVRKVLRRLGVRTAYAPGGNRRTDFGQAA
ncbi:hypothetical protein [Verrucosispora sp. TAA-831]|uniref:hypothetical protein n=1 Tax=Verrucosispora sp. TAA-831 TaxID=3422227 RepID=UPI003D6F18A7